MRRILLFLSVVIASLQAATVDDLTFVLNEAGTEYSITDCNEYASGDLEIPSTYQGFPVTIVADKAFKNCTSLTSITIPDSVTTIGEESFYNTGITSIVIPDSVTSIGYAAFQNCNSLTTVTLPDALTRLKAFTFKECYSLTSINIPSNIEFIGDSAIEVPFEIPDSVTCYGSGNGGVSLFGDTSVIFSGGLGYRLSSSGENAYIVELEGQSNFLGSPGTTLSGDIVIPQTIDGATVKSVTFTGWISLDNNSAPGITGITVSEGIVSIASAAFWGFQDLVSVNLPESLTTIGEEAFKNCTSLSSITIPKNVSSIEVGAFNGASNLNEIIVDPENAHYTLVDNSLYDISLQRLVRCRADATSFTIPNTVKTIEWGTFGGCSNLTSVNIPDSVTSIGYAAFQGCTGLTSITIPDSVTSIVNGAFSGCTNLTNITIGAGLNSLEGFTYKYWWNPPSPLGTTPLENLPDINISSENPYFTVINGVAFNKAEDTLLDFLIAPSDQSYTIPNNVTTIGDSAFANTNLTSIIIPDGVTSIGNGAFANTNLTSIIIPDSVTSIGMSAFKNTNSMTNWNGLVLGVDLVFAQNGDLTYRLSDCITSFTGHLVIPSDYGGLPVTTIGINAFDGCTSLTSITIPDSVTSIGSYAFDGCTSLTSINIPESVTSIGSYAFDGCTSLTSINIPESVTSIGDLAFYNCTSLTDITIPGGVTLIGENAFESCTGLTSITIADGVTTIGNGAFFGCVNLTSIAIPDSVTSIGRYAFEQCYSLTSIDIPDGMTSIGEYAFARSNITNIIIPNSVTSIGGYAFSRCDNLTSITIPDSVANIGSRAFEYCYQMQELRIGDRFPPELLGGPLNYIGVNTKIIYYGKLNNLPLYDNNTNIYLTTNSTNSISNQSLKQLFSEIYIDNDSSSFIPANAFRGYSNLKSVTIPENITSIGLGAFYDCTNLSNISLSEGLVSIKESAFYNCDQLETISIPSTVRDIGTDAFDNCEELREITFEGPPPAFSVTNLQSYNITPTMYYKVSPQSWMVYQSSYGLPLVYLGPPTIQVQPQNAIASAGDSIRLSVEATDVRETSLSYQWMCNGIELSGETEATLSIDSVTQSDVGNYQVKVTNAEGTTVSEGAAVTFASSGSSGDLYTQAQFDAALTSGFNLGVSSVQNNAADYGLVAEDSIEDARAGSSSIQTNNGTTTLQLQIERSDDLTNWTRSEEDLISIPVEVSTDSEYFRFAMP